MKKVLFVLAIAGFFAACGAKNTESATETAAETQMEETTTATPTETAVQQ